MVLFLLLLAYVSASVGYLFVLAVWGRFFFKRHKWPASTCASPKRIAILVPAYKEDAVILATASNLLDCDYPKDNYDIYIIADSFRPETLRELARLPVRLLEVSFEKSTKTKALNAAFQQIDKPYDIALICDGDNMLAPDFLAKTSEAFNGGARATQGKRIAKNLDTSFAILDASSEAINNHIFRKGTNAIGLSSAVIGSGMAFEFDTVRNILKDVDAVGGFDKVLQLKIVQQGIYIWYLEDAVIFDEKVDNPSAFSQQRKRWISSQINYARQFFFPAFKELFRGNLSYFNLAVINNSIPPKALFLLMLPLLIGFGFLLGIKTGIAACFVLVLYFATLLLALPQVLADKHVLGAVLVLPRAVFLLFRTLFQLRKADERFIHTPHTKTGITNSSERGI